MEGIQRGDGGDADPRAIVVLLAIPVVDAVGGGLRPASLGYLVGLAVLLILLTGLQRRPWAIWVNLGARRCWYRLRRVPGCGFHWRAVRRVVGPDRVFACRGAAASGLLRRNDRFGHTSCGI